MKIQYNQQAKRTRFLLKKQAKETDKNKHGI